MQIVQRPDAVIADTVITDTVTENRKVVTLSSKGQLVIPKQIRDDLQLEAGMEFLVRVEHGEIILRRKPDVEAALKALNKLCGMFEGKGLIDDLEAEHRWEIERDEQRIASLGS